MRILFAAPDRDLLECCKAILESDLGETVTAFDGTQVISLISTESFDIVILDRDLPRINRETLIERISAKGIPVIVLTDEPVGARELTKEPVPNAFFPYPFTSEQLEETLRDVLDKAAFGKRFDVSGVEIDVCGFRITDGPGLTAGEIDVLRAIRQNERVTTDDGACISAVNSKLAQIGSGVRIRYIPKKGFEAVTEDE